MKKSRFLPLTLALALTASLAVPAFAAEDMPDTNAGYVTAEPVEGIADPVLEVMPSTEPVVPTEWEVIAPTPAFEEEPDEFDLFLDAFVADYTAAHPEEYANFDADAVFAEEYGYWWTVDEYMEYFGEDGETLKDAMWREYVEEKAYTAWYAKEVEEYRANHPGELESLGVNELLARRGYRDPMEEFMDNYGYTTQDEVLTDLYYGYIQDQEWAAYLHELAEEYKAEYPELWAGFDVEAYFAENYSWYESQEEYMRWNDLWTYDAFVDDIFTDYVEEQIYGNGWHWMSDLTLVVNGETQWDSSLYVEDGVSYLPADELNAILGTHYTKDTPIRDAATAQGWDVVWNAWTNEIVLLNKTEVTAGWDFTNFDAMLNRMLEGLEYEQGKPLHTKETADITLTQFNTLDGDEVYTFKVTVDTVMQDNVINMTLSANLDQLLQMLPQSALNQIEYQMPKLTFQNLKTMLTNCKVQMIINLEEGMAYVNAPILSLLDASVTDQTWLALELGDVYSANTLETLNAMLAGEWSTADYLYALLLNDSATTYYSAEFSYEDVEAMGIMLGSLLGNEAVVEKNGTYTWKMDIAALDKMVQTVVEEMAGDLSEEEKTEILKEIPAMSDIFKEFDMTMTVDQDGKFTASATLRLNMDGIATTLFGLYGPLYYWYMPEIPDFRLTGKSEGSAQHATSTTELHVKNQFKLVIQEVSDVVKDTPTVRTAPPAGAAIVEW